MHWNNVNLFALLLIFSLPVSAHPTGNMIVVNERVYWSYIYPVESEEHRACVMTWSDCENPYVVFQSQYPSSDFMLSTKGEQIYLIERRYLREKNIFKSRILKMKPGEKPTVIWDWFTDQWRIGEGGFYMLSDDEIIFAKYPEAYRLIKGKNPTNHFEFDFDVKKIRAVENNQVLLLGDSVCYLVQPNGTISNQWNNIIDESVKNAPLNRNQIFDVDYKDGRLLTAYWGNRSFEVFDEKGILEMEIQQNEPLTPHWVAFRKNQMLLFSSELIFNGRTPRPYLVLSEGKKSQKIIWKIP